MAPRITSARRGVGAVITAVGSLAVTASAYRDWYAGEGPRDWPLQQLFQASPAGTATAYWGSVAAPLAVVGILGLLGALLRYRFILGLAWLLGAATFALWVIMRMIDSGWTASDLQAGGWICLTGLTVLLVGIIVMGPRSEEIEAPFSMFGDDDPPQRTGASSP